MGWFDSVAKDMTEVVGDVTDGVKSGIEAVETAGETLAKGTEDAIDTIEDGVSKTLENKKSYTAMRTASSEVKNTGNALALFEKEISQSILNGASWVGRELQQGAVYAQEGLVATGKFTSENTCSVAIGTAISTALKLMSTDSKKEATLAALAIAISSEETEAIQSASTAVTTKIIDAICLVHEFSTSHLDKSTAKQLLEYTVMMAIKQNKSEVVSSKGHYLVGAVLTVLTGFICSGELPGQFKAWQDAQ